MDKNKIQKPITLIQQEFTENLTRLINNSNLPYFLVEYILKDLLNGIHLASQKQLEFDIQNYESALKQCSNTEIHNSKK